METVKPRFKEVTIVEIVETSSSESVPKCLTGRSLSSRTFFLPKQYERDDGVLLQGRF